MSVSPVTLCALTLTFCGLCRAKALRHRYLASLYRCACGGFNADAGDGKLSLCTLSMSTSDICAQFTTHTDACICLQGMMLAVLPQDICAEGASTACTRCQCLEGPVGLVTELPCKAEQQAGVSQADLRQFM